jgi:AcrR family transcriptional regulator
MNGYELRAQKKRAAILSAARDLFFARGIKDVSVNEIAQKARVSPVTVFKYFGDKKSLSREVVLEYIQETVDQYTQLLARDIPFPELMRETLRQKTESISLMELAVTSAAWSDPAMQQLIHHVYTCQTVPIYLKFIEIGKRDGAIDASIPDQVIVDFFTALVPIIQDPGYPNKGRDYFLGFLKLLFNGLLKEDINI